MSLPLALSSLLLAGSLSAETVAGLTLHVQKLNPNTVRAWIGDHVSSTATVAFATSKGIVVVDTLGNPAVDREMRRILARELGRSDFKVLINTHEHMDHTGGNAVYADCTIVAHDRCAAGMKANLDDLARSLEWSRTRIAELEKEVAKEPAGSPKLARLKEELELARLNQAMFASAPQPAYPTKTFTDTLSLDMGDTTFELFFAGGMHSPSDVDVLVPRHGLLLTGDTMADTWLTESPGCLASFAMRTGTRRDVPLLFSTWERLAARKDQIRQLVPGHWNGTLSMKGFEDRCAYIRTLWDGIQKSVQAGKPAESLFQDFPLRRLFPHLAGSPGFNAQNHAATLAGIWSELTKNPLDSASMTAFQALHAGNGEAALKEILAAHGRQPQRYYYLEGEFNGMGYALLQAGKPAEAVALFKAGTQIFPGSWNAFDSLAEACLAAGHRDQAIANYEKSLQLNPESKSGKEALARLKAGGH